MYLYTTRKPKGLGRSRRVLRAAGKPVSSVGYTAESAVDHYVPTLSFYVDGSDGVRYSVSLEQADIDKINEARQKHARLFDPAAWRIKTG